MDRNKKRIAKIPVVLATMAVAAIAFAGPSTAATLTGPAQAGSVTPLCGDGGGDEPCRE